MPLSPIIFNRVVDLACALKTPDLTLLLKKLQLAAFSFLDEESTPFLVRCFSEVKTHFKLLVYLGV